MYATWRRCQQHKTLGTNQSCCLFKKQKKFKLTLLRCTDGEQVGSTDDDDNDTTGALVLIVVVSALVTVCLGSLIVYIGFKDARSGSADFAPPPDTTANPT